MPPEEPCGDLGSAQAALALALELSDAALWELDVAAGVGRWSDRLRALVDIPPEVPATIQAWLDRVHPDDRARVQEELADAVQSGLPIQLEWRGLRRDDSIRWFMARGGPVPATSDRGARYVGVIIDVTDRRELEEQRAMREREIAAARQQARERALLAAMTAGVVLRNGEGSIVAWNPPMEAIARRSLASPSTEPPLFQPRDEDGTLIEQTANPALVALRENRDVHGMVVNVRFDDGPRWFRIDATRLRAPGEGVVTTIVDITDLRTTQDALTTSRKELREVLDAGHDGFYRADFGEGTVRHSARLNEILGLPAVETLVDQAAFRARMHPDDRPIIDPHYVAVLSGAKERFDLDFRVKHENGEWRWVRSRGKIVEWYGDGKPRRLVGTISDIHQTKSLREDLAVSEQRLALAVEASGIGLFELSLGTGRAWCNDQHEALLGRMPGGWTLEAFLDRVLPEHRASVQAAIDSPDEEGRFAFEVPIESRAGGVSWLGVRGRTMRGEDGAPRTLAGAITDITERRVAAEALGVAHAANEKAVADLRLALASVKTLTGLLPICMYCKKIRNDKGYWDRLETYLLRHTDAKLSHGICPECESERFEP